MFGITCGCGCGCVGMSVKEGEGSLQAIIGNHPIVGHRKLLQQEAQWSDQLTAWR